MAGVRSAASRGASLGAPGDARAGVGEAKPATERVGSNADAYEPDETRRPGNPPAPPFTAERPGPWLFDHAQGQFRRSRARGVAGSARSANADAAQIRGDH